jgi:hypothetical protein
MAEIYSFLRDVTAVAEKEGKFGISEPLPHRFQYRIGRFFSVGLHHKLIAPEAVGIGGFIAERRAERLDEFVASGMPHVVVDPFQRIQIERDLDRQLL